MSVATGPRAAAATGIGFGKSLLAGESTTNPTSIQFGPDGRLYVAQRSGHINVYEAVRDGRDDYRVTNTQTISSIQSIPNHHDDGSLAPGVSGRLVTGLLVTGSASRPVIYVSSSDPRVGGIGGAGDLGLDTNSGVISRLKWNGSSWAKRDLVLGLPRSEEVHAPNGMQLDPASNTLYLAAGGHTNMGAPSEVFADLPEYALSAAVLSIDLDAIGRGPYTLPTLDDQTRTGNPDPNDPWGGNDGRNQAMIVTGGPVQVYSPGYRNPYDLLISEAGRLYVTDNGHNAGQGGPPMNEGPQGNCTNAISEPGVSGPDSLHLVTSGYYGGHPDPTRGNRDNTFGSQSPVPTTEENPIECDHLQAGVESSALTTFTSSTNGIDEYTASNFGGAMEGDLLAAGWDNFMYRVVLNGTGTDVVENEVLFANLGERPLDVTAQPDGEKFPGTIWVVDHAASSIVVFEPNDYGGGTFECAGTDSNSLDEDGDGYTNADEIDNGTDPCSAGDVPPDADGDGKSDRNDGDDDNDGLSDRQDPFAVDVKNGKQTYPPIRYTWNPGASDPGGVVNSGFTGLMTNGTGYAKLFDPTKMTVGGAAGVFTLDRVPDGTALGGANSQRYGFQFGMHAGLSATGPFTVHTGVLAPFAGTTPQDDQSMGLMIGRGNQDDYLKLVLTANGGNGGIEVVKEVGGIATTQASDPLPMPGPDRVDLFLAVNQGQGEVQASYRVTTNSTAGPRTDLGGPVTVPTGWFLNNPMGLAVGLISTSAGPAPTFSTTWDVIEVTEDGTSGAPASSTFEVGGDPKLAPART